MARRLFRPNYWKYTRYKNFLAQIHHSDIPLGDIPDQWVESAAHMLASLYPFIKGPGGRLSPYDASAGQIRLTFRKVYASAVKYVTRYEALLDARDSSLTPFLTSFGERFEQARREGRLEEIIGDEAEEKGGCGCSVMVRIRDPQDGSVSSI